MLTSSVNNWHFTFNGNAQYNDSDLTSIDKVLFWGNSYDNFMSNCVRVSNNAQLNLQEKMFTFVGWKQKRIQSLF